MAKAVMMTGRMRVKATGADGTATPLQFSFSQKLIKRAGRWQAVFLDFSYGTP